MTEHDCDGDHEHYLDRVTLTLTPSGLTLNVLGLIGEIFTLLGTDQYDEARELLDIAGYMLAAAYIGKFDLLDASYENAVVDRFSEQLEDPASIASLNKQEEQ